MAWVRTSNPVEATTPAGRVRVVSGSMSAKVGLRYFDEMPVFTCSFTKSKTVTLVVSLPVPDVVGHAIWGFNGPGTGLAKPMGALT